MDKIKDFDDLISSIKYYKFNNPVYEDIYNDFKETVFLVECKFNSDGLNFLKSVFNVSGIINPLFKDTIQQEINEVFEFIDNNTITTTLGNLISFKLLYQLKTIFGLDITLIQEVFIYLFFDVEIKQNEEKYENCESEVSILSPYNYLILNRNKDFFEKYNINIEDIGINLLASLPKVSNILEIYFLNNLLKPNCSSIGINLIDTDILNIKPHINLNIFLRPGNIYVSYSNIFYSKKNIFLSNRVYIDYIKKVFNGLGSKENIIKDDYMYNEVSIIDKVGASLYNCELVLITKDFKKNLIEYKFKTTDDILKIKRFLETNGYGSIEYNIHGGKSVDTIIFTIKEKLEL